jgi:hypothetical protein
MFDTLGKRYGKLPSEILLKADTFDLMVFDVAVTYEQFQHNKQDKNHTEMYSQESIQEYWDKVKK